MQQGGVAYKAEGDYVVLAFIHSPPPASRHLHLAREGRSLIKKNLDRRTGHTLRCAQKGKK